MEWLVTISTASSESKPTSIFEARKRPFCSSSDPLRPDPLPNSLVLVDNTPRAIGLWSNARVPKATRRLVVTEMWA